MTHPVRGPWANPCEACGSLATSQPYGANRLCRLCKRLAASWCWVKIAGRVARDIEPRHEVDRPGKAYLCVLCGLWHWTSNPGPVPADALDRVGLLAALFTATGFRIHEHQANPRIAYPRDAP